MFQRIVLFITIAIAFCSCAPKNKDKAPVNPGDTYFSIKQFIVDQWNTYHGQPYSIQKITYLNGKSDTVMLHALSMDWAPIFKVFFETDISDPKYLGRYRFTMFEDNATITNNYYYEAKDDKLFTRKFQISADEFTNKVRSIYVETEKKSRWNTVTQKLFYIPVKTISIQEYEWSTGAEPKEMRIEYHFL